MRHLKTIQAFQDGFVAFAEVEDCDSGGGHEWLEGVLENLKDKSDTIKTDYILPLEHMIDLVSFFLFPIVDRRSRFKRGDLLVNE